MQYDITASIVLYENSSDILLKAINSFLNTSLTVKLFLVDNSPTSDLSGVAQDSRIEYIFNPSNPGFGAAHNLAINEAISIGSKYHFVVNPDIYFDADVVASMVDYMKAHSNVGMLMPQILNPDGTIQNLPKLLPNPFSIILRKLKAPASFYKSFIDKYELRFVNANQIYRTPLLSGCFTLLNLDAVKDVGSYDDNFFMYFEDWDLSRRMAEKYETIYFPNVSVYHEYESGANKNLRLLKIYLQSAIHYFSKWGWFFDKSRKKLNNQTLKQFKG